MSENKLNVIDLHKRYGEHEVLKGVSLQANAGDVISIIGSSGSGKSTFLRCINFLEKPSEGSIVVNGQTINLVRDKDGQLKVADKNQLRLLRTRLTMVFQHFNLWSHMTVLENVKAAFTKDISYHLLDALFRTPRSWRAERELTEKAMDLLAIFNLADKADWKASSLPYGQQRKLEIARALATNMKVLLLDEPAAGMNPTETAELLACINTIRDQFGVAILLIEHDMSLVMNVCQRIQVIDYGQTIAAGLPEEIASNPRVIAAYLGE